MGRLGDILSKLLELGDQLCGFLNECVFHSSDAGSLSEWLRKWKSGMTSRAVPAKAVFSNSNSLCEKRRGFLQVKR